MSRRYYQCAAISMAWMAFQAIYASDISFIVTLDRVEMQRRIDRMFPIVREGKVVTVELHHPQVIFTNHGNRIGLRVDVDASAAGQFSITGYASVDGVLRYANTSGEFFLDDASVKELQIDGVPAPYLGQIQQLADGLVRDLLQERPIYTLGQMGESTRIMGSKLKSVTVRNSKMVVELAMP